MPASAAQDDEQAFMAALLADLDPVDLFAPPSSPPLPSKTGARVGRRVTSSAGGSTSSAASSASLNVKGASSATPAARASSRLTSKNDRKPLIDSAFPPAASSPRPLLPTGSSSGSSSIIPPQHQHRQQQAFDDLIAGVTFDDDFDGDEWARGSSLPPPPAKKARAVARPPALPLLALRPTVARPYTLPASLAAAAPLVDDGWRPRSWIRAKVIDRSPLAGPWGGWEVTVEVKGCSPDLWLEANAGSIPSRPASGPALGPGVTPLPSSAGRSSHRLSGSRLTLELLDEWAAEEVALPSEGQTVNVLSPELPALFASVLSSSPPVMPPTPTTRPESPVEHSSPPPPRLKLSSRPPHVANLLILDPDRLVPATSLAASLSCPRRAVLRSLVREGISGPVAAATAANDEEGEKAYKPAKQAGGSKALLYGNVLHQVAQTLFLGATTTVIDTTGADFASSGCDIGTDVGGPFGERAIGRAVRVALGEQPPSPLPSPPVTVQSKPISLDALDDEVDRSDAIRSDVWKADLDWAEVTSELTAKALAAFGPFGQRFLPRAQGSLKANEAMDNLLVGGQNGTEQLTVVGLHAIEEDLRSPLWGLQGKVDLSLHVRLSQPLPKGARGGPIEVERAVPFEIKTGRTVGQTEHRAQTAVYCLLMEERYGTPVPAGLLYYTQPNAVHKVAAEPRDVRALICRRNILAGWLGRKGLAKLPASVSSPPQQQRSAGSDTTAVVGVGAGQTTDLAIVLEDDEDDPYADAELELDLLACAPLMTDADDNDEHSTQKRLPETIDRERDCARCYQVDVCMLYRKAVEQVVDVNSPIADLYARKTATLDHEAGAFFRRWEALISLEEESASRFGRQIWTMTAAERQKHGRCFADMVITSSVAERGAKKARIHRHTYTFSRAVDLPPGTPSASVAGARSLLSGHIAPGDPIAISLEPGLVSLARGFVLDLQAGSVTVGLDGELDERVLRERLDARLDSNLLSSTSAGRLRFRIDKDELATGMGRIRDNLAQLFLASTAVAGPASSLRSLIVNLALPTFDSTLMPTQEELPAHLNADQRAAVTRVLTARDYALILGMPGTGKSTTIVDIVRALVGRGKTVLLTSYTHSAVDTIVSKLAAGGKVDLLRLGNPDKVHPSIIQYTLGALGPAASMEQFEERLMRPQVVATTALSIDHPLFSRRQFDYCIVDEASQITLPVCLGPLRFAKAFVLVGDHFQLPPLVKNSAARKGGLETSLFRLLHEAHPEASVSLAHQYRMNADIMSLSNALVYDGGLHCGDVRVATQTLNVPLLAELSTALSGSADDGSWDGRGQRDWLQQILDPSCKAVFLNTDIAALPESRVGDLVQNAGEARVVQLVIQALLQGGVDPAQLAAITLYRQQIKLLQHTLEATGIESVEIITADKSQGRDKDCVIVSMVRSNGHGSVGELLRDWRRINVAFTRAKAKLVIVGSRSTLAADPLLSRFLALMAASAWVIDLPSNVGLQHPQLSVLHEVKPEVDNPPPASASTPGPAVDAPSALTTPPTRRKRTNVKQESDDSAHNENSIGRTPTKPRVPKKARLSEEAILKGRPLLRDVLNEYL